MESYISTEPSTENMGLEYIPTPNAPFDNSSAGERKIPLYIGSLFSVSKYWDGGGVIVAVEMGLDHINARQDILRGYELKMVWNDTGVSRKVSYNSKLHNFMLKSIIY